MWGIDRKHTGRASDVLPSEPCHIRGWSGSITRPTARGRTPLPSGKPHNPVEGRRFHPYGRSEGPGNVELAEFFLARWRSDDRLSFKLPNTSSLPFSCP